jgi:hypothetical protein
MPLHAVGVRRHVLRELLDRPLRVAAPEPVRADLQRRPSEPEFRIGGVQLAQKELSLFDAAGAQARDAEGVQRGEVVGILPRRRLQQFDGVGEPSTVAASAMWAATGPRRTTAYSELIAGLMAATTPVVIAGTYVMSRTPTDMMTRKGRAFR